jgi:2-dehydropantoate 2-reductase
MKIGILGAGVMGQLFGARLALGGNDVVFIDAAPRTIEVLNEQGIVLTTDGVTEKTPARAGFAADFSESVELVVVFTKGFHTEAALQSIRHLISDDTLGLTLQNGLGNDVVLASFFGNDKTWVGTTDFPADMKELGVLHTSAGGRVRMGKFDEVADPRSWALVDVLNQAHLNTSLEVDIRPVIWEKVIFNTAMNTLSAVTGQTVGQMAASENARGIIAAIIDEGLAVAASQGIHVPQSELQGIVDNAFANHGEHKTSMLQDREAGRRTEIDFIGGAVAKIGAHAGVPTPVLSTLVAIVRDLTERG